MTKKSSNNCSKDACASDPLNDVDFFKSIRPATKLLLKKEGRTHNYSNGHLIFMNEDEASWFYVIEKGWIKIFRETLDGDEAVLDVMPAGSIFGETTLYENGTYPYSAEAIEDSRIVAYPIKILEKEIQENKDFVAAFLRHLTKKALAKDKDIELRSVQNASQRIGCFLLRLCKKGDGNSVTLHLAWEKSLIAARLGMAPETFSRSLAKLQSELGIRVKGSTIEISDIGALIRYTCTACSNVFPCSN